MELMICRGRRGDSFLLAAGEETEGGLGGEETERGVGGEETGEETEGGLGGEETERGVGGEECTEAGRSGDRAAPRTADAKTSGEGEDVWREKRRAKRSGERRPTSQREKRRAEREDIGRAAQDLNVSPRSNALDGSDQLARIGRLDGPSH